MWECKHIFVGSTFFVPYKTLLIKQTTSMGDLLHACKTLFIKCTWLYATWSVSLNIRILHKQYIVTQRANFITADTYRFKLIFSNFKIRMKQNAQSWQCQWIIFNPWWGVAELWTLFHCHCKKNIMFAVLCLCYLLLNFHAWTRFQVVLIKMKCFL
jgi:hypothetical protein